MKINLNSYMIVMCIKMNDANKIYKLMLAFQKENNIKGKCIANTYYFNKVLKDMDYYDNPKAKAVIAVYCTNDNVISGYVVHMVTYLGEDNIVDTSYEVSQHEVTYYDKFHLVPFPDGKEEMKKDLLTKFIEILKIEKKINEGDIPRTEDYIEKQHNWISERLLLFNSLKTFVSKTSM